MSFLKTYNLSRVVSLEIGLHIYPSPSTLSITTGLQSSENKDVSIGPGFHPVHSPFHLPSVGARAFKLGEPNLKVGRPKFFIDFNPEKAYRA